MYQTIYNKNSLLNQQENIFKKIKLITNLESLIWGAQFILFWFNFSLFYSNIINPINSLIVSVGDDLPNLNVLYFLFVTDFVLASDEKYFFNNILWQEAWCILNCLAR